MKSQGTKITKDDWEQVQILKKAEMKVNQIQKIIKRSWLPTNILYGMDSWSYEEYIRQSREYYKLVRKPKEEPKTATEVVAEQQAAEPPHQLVELVFAINTLNEKLDLLNYHIEDLTKNTNNLSGGVWTVRKLLLKQWEPEEYEMKYGIKPDEEITTVETDDEEEPETGKGLFGRFKV